MRAIKLITLVILGLAFQVAAIGAFAQSTHVSVCVTNLSLFPVKLCQKSCGGRCTPTVKYAETTKILSVPLNSKFFVCFENRGSFELTAVTSERYIATVIGSSLSASAMPTSGCRENKASLMFSLKYLGL